MKIKELNKGDFFTLKRIDFPSENQVYIKGEYDRHARAYSATKFSDVNCEKFFKGEKEVFIGFIF